MNQEEIKNAERIGKQIKKSAEGIDNRDPEVLIIDRSFWGRGGNISSQLLTEQVNNAITMCCLGFLCLERKLAVKQIYNAGTPMDVRKDIKGRDLKTIPKGMEKFLKMGDYGLPIDTKLTDALVEVNDKPLGKNVSSAVWKLLRKIPRDKKLHTEEQREQLITRLFKTADITVTFVN